MFAGLLVISLANADCGSETQALATWLSTFPTHYPLGELRLAESPGGARLSVAPWVELYPGSVLVQGVPVGDAPSGVRALEDADAFWPGAKSYLLFIDRATPWKEVVDWVTAAADARWADAGLVFARQGAIEPPARSSITSRVKGLRDDEAGLQTLFDIAMDVLAPCTPAVSLLEGLAASGDPLGTYAAEMPAALKQCECATSVADVATLSWSIFGPTADTTAVDAVSIRFSPPSAPPQASVHFSADTPWNMAVGALAKAAQGPPVTLMTDETDLAAVGAAAPAHEHLPDSILSVSSSESKVKKRVNPDLSADSLDLEPFDCDLWIVFDERGIPFSVEFIGPLADPAVPGSVGRRNECPRGVRPVVEAAFLRWRFEPVVREGVAVKAKVKMRYRFQ